MLQVNMQKTCLESSSMRPTPSPSGSTPCRSVWTDSPSVSPSWTPKKRSVSSHKLNPVMCRGNKMENFYVQYKQLGSLTNLHVNCCKVTSYNLLMTLLLKYHLPVSSRYFHERTVKVPPQLCNIPACAANTRLHFVRGGNWIRGTQVV